MKLTMMMCCLTLGVLAGCSSLGPSDQNRREAAAAKQAHAECAVCKVNADLACLDVAVDENTPRSDYNGKTYYFCSEECKEKFAKKPQRYAGK